MLLPLCHLIHTTLYKNIEPFQFTMLENRLYSQFCKHKSLPPKWGLKNLTFMTPRPFMKLNYTSRSRCSGVWKHHDPKHQIDVPRAGGWKFWRPTNPTFVSTDFRVSRFEACKFAKVLLVEPSNFIQNNWKEHEAKWHLMVDHDMFETKNEANKGGRNGFFRCSTFFTSGYYPWHLNHLIPPIGPPKGHTVY